MTTALASIGAAQVRTGHESPPRGGPARRPSAYYYRLAAALSARWPGGTLNLQSARGTIGAKDLAARSLSPLQACLATSAGFASYLEVQHWLREEVALDVPYKTLHDMVRSQLKAKLKRPHPSHGKKRRRSGRHGSTSWRGESGRAWPPYRSMWRALSAAIQSTRSQR